MERIPIRFDRAIKPEWLDFAVDQAVKSANDVECRKLLKEYIDLRVEGSEAKLKTVTQLLRFVGSKSQLSRERLVLLHQELLHSSPNERTHIHLEILLQSSPFFSDCVAAMRKLSILGQEGIGISQLYDRLITLYGDRAIVPRSVENVLTTLLWFGLVKNCNRRWVPSEVLLSE